MQDSIVKGWYRSALRCESPNHNDRPDPRDISLLVIHNISLPPGEYGGGFIQQFFCNELDCDCHPYFDSLREFRVSAHFLIDRRGQTTQFAPLQARAWHAGASEFCGRSDCNDFSIGIELEGTDHETYTDQQYASLVQLTREIMQVYPAITPARITGHSDIAPGRKTDPGPAFDWQHYLSLLNQGLTTP